MEDNGSNEVKPKTEGAPALNLVIRDQNQTDVHFKVKPTTKFEKIFKVYCEKKGVEVTAVK
jgi:small ubiquitin-related modifier